MEKLLLIADMVQRGYGRWLFQRMIPNLLIVFGIVTTLAMCVTALLTFGLFGGYQMLLTSGFTPQFALLYTLIFAILVIFLLSGMVFYFMRKVHIIPQASKLKLSSSSSAMDLLHAFVSGLMADPKQK